MTGEAGQAIRVAQRAIDLNPNFAEAYTVLGYAYIFCGELEAGMAACHRAERGNPRDSRGTWLYDAMGHGYFFLGDYEKAIEVSKKGLHQDPSAFGTLVTLACAYAQQGRDKEAKHYMEELLQANSTLLNAGVAEKSDARRSQAGGEAYREHAPGRIAGVI